jgi:hypothetical protein
MTTKQPDKKEQIWLLVFIIFPSVFLGPSSEFFAEPGINRILISGALAGLGAIIGFGVYSMVKGRKPALKAITLIGLILLSFTSLIVTANLTKTKFETCEICGYEAIIPTSEECQFCGNSTWTKENSDGSHSTKEEWIKEQQLFWFRIDSLNQKINFFTPANEEGYAKNKSWKPLVTEQEILNDFDKK